MLRINIFVDYLVVVVVVVVRIVARGLNYMKPCFANYQADLYIVGGIARSLTKVSIFFE